MSAIPNEPIRMTEAEYLEFERQSEIRQHKKIIVCENCGRILVDDELNAATEMQK